MKVTFYLADHAGKVVDATNIEKGNPGIGGAQYCMLLLAHYLRLKGYEITIIAHRKYLLEDGIEGIFDVERSRVVSEVQKKGTDILIVKNFIDKDLEKSIRKSKLKVVIWSHNFIYSDFADFIKDTPQVIANVFVGKQQYDNYIDDDVIKKSVTIFNMFPDSNVVPQKVERNKSVVFMGVIEPGKGFYEMARMWQGIVSDVPEAQLYVLGNGCLYGEQQMGKLGIAEQHYEKKLEPLICDAQGEILKSIHFCGIVGGGKNAYFEKASIGVINPSSSRETFGMGALEMASAKLPVATIGKTGYFDTIVNGETGILCKNISDLQKSIIEILKSNTETERLGNNAKVFLEKFSPQIIVDEWDCLLKSVYSDKFEAQYQSPSKPFTSQLKWLRVCNRFIRFSLRLKFVPSILRLESFVRNVLR